jgi:hypothetical protein
MRSLDKRPRNRSAAPGPCLVVFRKHGSFLLNLRVHVSIHGLRPAAAAAAAAGAALLPPLQLGQPLVALFLRGVVVGGCLTRTCSTQGEAME